VPGRTGARHYGPVASVNRDEHRSCAQVSAAAEAEITISDVDLLIALRTKKTASPTCRLLFLRRCVRVNVNVSGVVKLS